MNAVATSMMGIGPEGSGVGSETGNVAPYHVALYAVTCA